MVWIQFIVSSVLIVFSGVKLTQYADVLSDRLGSGKVLMGVILLGLVTSLPESVASLTAVISLGANDLAVGNMVGSNCFNPMLIVVMDLVYRKGSITNQIDFSSHLKPVIFAIILTGVVIVEILLSLTGPFPTLFSISLGSFVLIIVYFGGMKIIAKDHAKNPHQEAQPCAKGTTVHSLGKIYCYLAFSAVCVVAGAMWLTNIADKLAEITGWGETFVGTLFLAFVTSLPEMVVTLSALKLGALDLAVGNIFGSNMTNMFLIAVCDIFYVKGPVLSTVSISHAFSASLSILLTGVVLTGIKQKHKLSFGRLGWDSIALIFMFLGGMVVLYTMK